MKMKRKSWIVLFIYFQKKKKKIDPSMKEKNCSLKSDYSERKKKKKKKMFAFIKAKNIAFYFCTNQLFQS